ncbi:SLAP domain-containing protein [Exiguobacterium profundum]|uniref:SLAP domain-containing protein n=1 Tax=Exiguobacterium TaxID=33986 RepID=UPI001BAD8DEE|nr:MULTISPECIES: SLAP domain-containing protein [Exiguobacterium]MDX5980040.1 SLAP domain-containing protein [Exiguobacterium profundum]QUP88013.1 SLAP domain-containing protein [Exiguobacterium sp. PFWT01]
MLGFRKRKQIETGNKEEGRQLTLVIDDAMGIPKEDEYVFRYHAKRLPNLMENQVSIELLHAERIDEGMSTVALFRNTLPSSFEIDELPVLLLDEHHLPLGRKVLSRIDLPKFEPWTSKPVYLHFFPNELFSEVELSDTLRLVFQMNPIDPLQVISDEMRAQFSLSEWRQLMRTNISTPPVGENEFNLMLVSVEKEETDVKATILLRNGYDRHLNVEKLPLELVSGEDVVGFKMIRLEEPIHGKHAYPVVVTFEEIEGDGPFTVRIKQ